MIPAEKKPACPIAWELVDFSRLVKNDTVIGIIGKTQGVSNAKSPCRIANQRNPKRPRFLRLFDRSSSLKPAPDDGGATPPAVITGLVCASGDGVCVGATLGLGDACAVALGAAVGVTAAAAPG